MPKYTEIMHWADGRYEQFRFYKSYKGKSWHDMCIVDYWNEEKQRNEKRAARLLTLIIFEVKVNVMKPYLPYIVVNLSERVVSMEKIETKFIVPFKMGDNLDILPVSAIKNPLAVWANNGGNKNEFFAILPRRKWAEYFTRKIETNINK